MEGQKHLDCVEIVLRLSRFRLRHRALVCIPALLHLVHVIQSHYSEVPELWQITVACKSWKVIYLGNYSALLIWCLVFVRQQDTLQISVYCAVCSNVYSACRPYSGPQWNSDEWGSSVNQFIRFTSVKSCKELPLFYLFFQSLGFVC